MNASRRFIAVGHMQERTTTTGIPYLTGRIAGQQLFIFPQADGSWTVFLQEDEPRVPPAARVSDRPADQQAYEKTLAGMDVPDYDEPLRRHPLRERAASRSGARKESGGTMMRRSSRKENS